MRTRARTPNVGSYNQVLGFATNDGATTYTVRQGDVNPNWSNVGDIEFVGLLNWEQSRHTITRMTRNSVTVAGETVHEELVRRYFLENSFEALDTPGEWYLDTRAQKLYYWPLQGEDLANAHVVAPQTQQLVRLEGGAAINQSLSTDSFSVATWLHPNQNTNDARPFFSKGDSVDAQRVLFSLNGSNKVQMLMHDGRQAIFKVSERSIPINTWTHVTLTWNADTKTLTLYINGQADTEISNQAIQRSIAPQGHIRIGSNSWYFFPGYIDDTVIYQRPLAAQEISALYEDQTIPSAPAIHYAYENNFLDSAQGNHGIPLKIAHFVDGKHGQAMRVFNRHDGLIVQNYLRDMVHDITFEGIHFHYSDWQLPPGGYPGGQAFLPHPWAALYLDHTNRIVFRNNSMRYLGTTALGGASSRNIHVTGNTIEYVGGAGVRFGDYYPLGAFAPTRTENYILKNNHVTNNYVRHFGTIFWDSPGIWIYTSRDNVIRNNLVAHGPSRGIDLGWGSWDIITTIGENNIIDSNEVHAISKVFFDGGGIHTLGRQTDTRITNNYIHDITFTSDHPVRIGLSGIYLDEGSNDITVENNLVTNTGHSVTLHRARGNTLVNNMFLNATADQQLLFNGTSKGYANGLRPANNRLERNIIVRSNPNTQLINTGSGGPQDHSISIMNHNLFFDTQGAQTDTWNLPWWQSNYGFDQQSLVADPLFVNDAAGAYRLAANSPARALGFQQFDLSGVGPSRPASTPPPLATPTPTPQPEPALTQQLSALNLSLDEEDTNRQWGTTIIGDPGDRILFGTRLTNTGDGPAQAITIRATLPSGVTYEPGSTRIDNEIQDDSIAAAEGLRIASLGNNAEREIYFIAKIAPTVTNRTHVIKPRVRVTADNHTALSGAVTITLPGANPTTTPNADPTPTVPSSISFDATVFNDSRTTKPNPWDSTITAEPGNAIVHRIRITNTSTTPTEDITVRAALHPQLQYVRGWTKIDEKRISDNGIVTTSGLRIASIDPGESVRITFRTILRTDGYTPGTNDITSTSTVAEQNKASLQQTTRVIIEQASCNANANPCASNNPDLRIHR